MTVKTMKYQGRDYAQVPDRLKAFREDCPRGLIETKHELIDDGQIVFSARVVKDKSDPYSAEATGHSYGKQGAVKAFEKLETVAVGRALALLGYLQSGEIASSEEMEEFESYREEKIQVAVDTIGAMTEIDALKEYFLSLGTLMSNEEVMKAKDAKKAELTT
jgi:FtsZ-binding cell division protein ZapB